MPPLTETVTIDASSVWNTATDEPGVTIDGEGIGFHGITLNADSCQIYGLYITDFVVSGLNVVSASNKIGDCVAGQRNVLSGNSIGIKLYGSSAQSNLLRNNYIGLTPEGNSKNPNVNGLLITGDAHDNIIGGTDPSHVNFIAGNDANGIMIEGTSSDHNWLVGNVIGLASDLSSQLSNGAHGIRIQNGPNDTIIGGGDIYGNIIDYNTQSSIYLFNAGNGTVISYNLIGGNGTMGIEISNSIGIMIMDNLISNNTLDGVRVDGASASGNLIWANSIWNNGRKGISLSSGGNLGIAAPIINKANQNGASGTTCASCVVALYSDANDEGQYYHDIVLADAAGNWIYNGLLNGPNVTATSIDNSSNTSEFSTPLPLSYLVFVPVVTR